MSPFEVKKKKRDSSCSGENSEKCEFWKYFDGQANKVPNGWVLVAWEEKRQGIVAWGTGRLELPLRALRKAVEGVGLRWKSQNLVVDRSGLRCLLVIQRALWTRQLDLGII